MKRIMEGLLSVCGCSSSHRFPAHTPAYACACETWRKKEESERSSWNSINRSESEKEMTEIKPQSDSASCL